jgi:hypothetical protein
MNPRITLLNTTDQIEYDQIVSGASKHPTPHEIFEATQRAEKATNTPVSFLGVGYFEDEPKVLYFVFGHGWSAN